MTTHYRFKTADGQVYESTEPPETIVVAYPTATITHQGEEDARGEVVMAPYAAPPKTAKTAKAEEPAEKKGSPEKKP